MGRHGAEDGAMILIGMLDSPYVRRVAIAGTLLQLPFEHRSISVFRHMDRFRAINPLIKAPTLVAGDGTVLMDSELILTHLEDMAGKSLRPETGTARTHDLRTTGIALVTCEKAVQLEYERKRPDAFQYQPWMDRVRVQLDDALTLLNEIAARDWASLPNPLTHGAIAAAVAVGFIRFTLPGFVDLSPFPELTGHADRCEATAAFRHWPIDRENP